MSNPPNEPPDPGPIDAGDEAAAENASSDVDPGTAATSTEGDTSGRSDDDTGPRPREIGGQAGPEPTRYGDWEKKGRCTDF